MKVVHFKTATEFRHWLGRNHDKVPELWVGFHHKAAGRGGLTYDEALDEALCFGWIDGIRKNVGPDSYTNRFTPRRPGSVWSNVNVRHVERLIAEKRMQPSGLAAFAGRIKSRTGIYAFETPPQKLPKAYEARFREQPKAWAYFIGQAPWYQRTAIHKVVSPKLEATRLRWLEQLIADSAAGKRLDALTDPPRR